MVVSRREGFQGLVLFRVLLMLVGSLWGGVGPADAGAARQRQPAATRQPAPALRQAAPIRMLVVKTEEEAREAVAQVQAGVPFERIVREKSIGPARERGGYLGRVHPATLPPVARTALARTRRGRLTPIFQTEIGFAVIQVLTDQEEQEQEARIRREPEAMDLLTRGTELGRQGDLEKAVALLHQAIEMNPTLEDAHFNLGIALWKLGRKEEAVAAMREAVRLRPEDVDASLRLGAWLTTLGWHAEASGYYERAAMLQMDSKDVWLKLAQSYEAAEKSRAAISAYRRVLGLLDREDPVLLDALLRVAMRAKDGPTAVDAAQRLQTFRSDHEGFETLGEALLLDGEGEAAIREFQMAVALAPASARAHVGLADAYTRLGQLEAASEHLLRAIRLDPGNPAQYERLAQLYERLSRLDLAIVALRDALGAAGEWPRQRQAELVETLASLYERAGMSREAEHTRQRAAALRTP